MTESKMIRRKSCDHCTHKRVCRLLADMNLVYQHIEDDEFIKNHIDNEPIEISVNCNEYAEESDILIK